MIDDIIQEATEAEEQGRDAGYAVGELLRIISQQNAEMRELKRKVIDKQKDIEKIAMKAIESRKELELKTMDVESLTNERNALQEMVADQKAEIDRLRYILVNFMGEIFDWGNKNGVDTGIFAQTAILGKEKDGAVKQIKSEAYREFADKVEKISKEVTVPYIADTSIQEHKTGMFYYGKEDFDNLLKELTEKNDKG